MNTLHLISVSPASGSPGTSITITGTGFGSSQGSGTVWLGSTDGQVLSWSDTQVVAAVASTSVTGVARMKQNDVWSNAVSFTVPVSGGVTLSPNMLSMVVGDTRTIQALNPAGQPATGLSWTSSDPNIVSLSSADPPLLSALAAGHVTIKAGAGSVDVNVYLGDAGAAGGLPPLGTVLWSNPGIGWVYSIVPAVPSPNGVADVFAYGYQFGSPNTTAIQAIKSDGAIAWTAVVGEEGRAMPDFQGGLIVVEPQSIVRLDGITGQPYPAYTNTSAFFPRFGFPQSASVHTDGTVVAYQMNPQWVPSAVIGVDSTTGALKFSVPLQCPQYLTVAEYGLIIAGDGYAYLPYICVEPNGFGLYPVNHLWLLRVNSSGVSDNIKIFDWASEVFDAPPIRWGGMITNADQGVLLNWGVWRFEFPGPVERHMAITTGTSVSLMNGPAVPDQVVEPVLQAQDGSFVGVVYHEYRTPPSSLSTQPGTCAGSWPTTSL